MTVSTINSVAEFETNGATKTFPFYFKFLENKDLVVTYISPDGVSTVLAMGTQYTVSGAGNDKGGSVTTTAALAGPGQLIVSRDMEAYQKTSLRNQGRFLAETHEDVFDKLTMLSQQGFAGLERALVRPLGREYFNADENRISDLADPESPKDAVTKDYADEAVAGAVSHAEVGLLRTVRSVDGETLSQLPAASSRANKVMGFDANGQPIGVLPASGSGTELAIDLANPVDPLKGASMLKFSLGGEGSIPLDVRSRLVSAVYFEDFGAKGNGLADDSIAIRRADARAKALGVPLAGSAGRVYRVGQKLQLTSDWIWGNWSRINVEGVGATVGWGNRPTTTYDGFFGGFIFDAANAINATPFRFAGNHERPKIRGIVLLNTDQYAFGMGALGSSDKNDVVNYLDIDGIHIESFRGNIADATEYSFGFEFFPGANCKGWRIRNATTYGKILNKFHSCDAIDIDHVHFKASERFNPKSSAYCEVNSCDNIIIGDACVFDSGLGNITDHAFMINGTRVPGGLTTNVARVGAWCRNAALANVNGITLTDSFRALWLYLSGVSGAIALGGTIERLTAQAGTYVTKIEASPKKLNSIRFEELSDLVIGRFVISGGILGDRLDFRGNMKVIIHGSLIDCAGSTKLYVVQANGEQCSVTISLCTLDGGGTLNRPMLAQNGGVVRLINNNLDNLVSSVLIAPTSQPLSLNVGNVVNGLKV